jgi:hypothetical protein
MKYGVLSLFLLVLAAAFFAGCTQTAAPTATPVPTAAPTQTAVTTASLPAFTLGDSFFAKKYSWQDGAEVYTEQFMVPEGQPWGVKYDITPLNDDPQKCWYEVTVSDVNNPSHTQSFGYNRGSYSNEKSQIHPVYGHGSFKIEMKGNYVKVDMTAAKRNV